MNYSTPGLPVYHQLLEFTKTHVHWVGDAIQPSHPLLSPFPPAFNFSQHQGLFWLVNLHMRWPKYWSFSFSINPFNEYSGLISFRMDWLDLLSVQGTEESSPTPQFKSTNSLTFSFLYGPTLTSTHDYWKTVALTRQTFAGKVTSLLLNMLSRLVTTFLPRSKCLLISCCSHHLQ